jgi:hypothetical protein
MPLVLLWTINPKGLPTKPMRRVLQRLINFQNVASMASLLENEIDQICEGNIFGLDCDQYNCQNCYNGIQTFSQLAQKLDLKKRIRKTTDLFAFSKKSNNQI